MQLLQPEIRRIAEKYKDNMEGRTKAQQELFKKHNYHPLSGCGIDPPDQEGISDKDDGAEEVVPDRERGHVFHCPSSVNRSDIMRIINGFNNNMII